MNVAFLTLGYPPYVAGGIETYVHLLAKEFVNRKIKITVITAWFGNSVLVESPSKNLRIVRFPIVDKPIRPVWFPLYHKSSILRLLENIDVVQANACQTSSLNKLITKKTCLVTTLHGSLDSLVAYISSYSSLVKLSPGDLFYLSEYPLLLKLYRSDLSYSNALVPVSQHVLQEAKAYLGNNQKLVASKSRIIPCGIDLNELAVEQKTERTKKITKPLQIAFIGRLFWPKGISFALETIRTLVNHFGEKQTVLHIMGDGPLKVWTLRYIKQNQLSQNVILYGKVKRDNLINILRTVDSVLMPSLYEGCPYALLEANALGKPVIAFDLKWSRDFIVNGVNGYRSEPFNVEKLAEAVLRSVSLKSSAISGAVVKYDIKNVASEILNLYDSVS
jgi:glycosyltransferase involved in cell wall biosynthesis